MAFPLELRSIINSYYGAFSLFVFTEILDDSDIILYHLHPNTRPFAYSYMMASRDRLAATHNFANDKRSVELKYKSIQRFIVNTWPLINEFINTYVYMHGITGSLQLWYKTRIQYKGNGVTYLSNSGLVGSLRLLNTVGDLPNIDERMVIYDIAALLDYISIDKCPALLERIFINDSYQCLKILLDRGIVTIESCKSLNAKYYSPRCNNLLRKLTL